MQENQKDKELKDQVVGFIGCGNMGQAMMRGMLSSDITIKQLIFSNRNESIGRALCREMDSINPNINVEYVKDNSLVATKSDIVFLAVKPQQYNDVLNEISEALQGKILISIAPGIRHKALENWMATSTSIIRIMPNTPADVRESMTAICPGAAFTNPIPKMKKQREREYENVKRLLATFGKVEEIEESLMDAFVALAGSSPAYVYLFLEAMADAAVLQGLPRKKAYTIAAQAVLGSAKMLLEKQLHPGELKDAVCSPGGTTIEGVAILEEKGLRSAVIQAMQAVCRKSEKMG